MTQKLVTESPEKTQQHVESSETSPASAHSFQGGLHPVAQLQRTLGNRHVAKLIQAKRLAPEGKIICLQRKLTVGAADDQYEQEADRVARQVMNTPDAVFTASAERAPSLAGEQSQTLQTRSLAVSITPIVRRQRGKENKAEEDKDREEEAEPIQAKSASALSDIFEAGADVETQVNLSKGRGSPLPDSVRAFMEPRFGMDLSHVHVHTGSDALQMNQAVGAQAFTHGSDIYFGAGRSPTNLELTAHELTHVVQQTGGVPLQTKKQEQPIAPLDLRHLSTGVVLCVPKANTPCPTCAAKQEEEMVRLQAHQKGGGLSEQGIGPLNFLSTAEQSSETALRLSSGNAVPPTALMQMQPLAGNRTVTRYLSQGQADQQTRLDAETGSELEQTVGLVQRDPLPAAAPQATTPSPVGTDSSTSNPSTSSGVWTLGGLLDGSQKIRFGLPNYTLYSERAGENFSWSVTKPGPVDSTPLAFGVIPVPPPVGPITLELGGGVSSYAGGNAQLNLKLENIEMEATAAELMRVGFSAGLLLTGMPILSLANLVGLNLKGRANIKATATSKLEAGADANLTALLNPTVWPIAGYGEASLGAYGAITAIGQFEVAAPIELSLGGFKIRGGAWDTKAGLSAEFGLHGSLAAGLQYGYQLPIPGVDTAGHFELIRYDVNLAKKAIDIKSVTEGRDRQMTLAAAGDGPPKIDMKPIIAAGKTLLQTLWEIEKGNGPTSTQQAQNITGDTPRVSAPGIGNIQRHGSKVPGLQMGPHILWLESEHIIPFGVGVQLFEAVNLAAPGRKTPTDRNQTTIMIYEGAADRKTRVDTGLITRFQNQFRLSEIPSRMDAARTRAEEGDANGARHVAAELVHEMSEALHTVKDDAVARTNRAIIDENASHTDNSPETNGQRRGPLGTPEPPIPEQGRVDTAAEQQFEDVFNLAADALKVG